MVDVLLRYTNGRVILLATTPTQSFDHIGRVVSFPSSSAIDRLIHWLGDDQTDLLASTPITALQMTGKAIQEPLHVRHAQP